jgi:Glycosyl transferase family 90
MALCRYHLANNHISSWCKAFTSRFPRLLQSGSLLFKSTRYREWYTERLKPYVHNIPVNYNLHDLEDKIAWAHQHFKASEQIMNNAHAISKQFFHRQEIQCYLYRVVLEYHELFEQPA